MREQIQVEVKDKMYAMIEGITFAQVPYFFPFCDYRPLKMDLILPFGPKDQPLPCLVWINGGGFLTMEKSAFIPHLVRFAEHGYIIASVEYRLSNSCVYPAMLRDVKSAIRYLRAHAKDFGIDSERIAVMGESAGGYLAAMAGATGNTRKFDLGENLDQSSAVCAVVDYYGPSGILSNSREPERATDKLIPKDIPVTEEEKHAVTFMDENTPPYYLLHGTDDPLVPCELSEKFYSEMLEKGVKADLTVIEGAGHADPRFYQKSTDEKVLAFLDKIMK